MGTLTSFSLSSYIESYGIETFIETGTYKGDGLEYASRFGFKNLFSIELMDKFYLESLGRFSGDPRVSIIKDTSIDGLEKITKEMESKCIFWLDAHLPNFYDPSYGNDYSGQKELLIPLEDELKVIKNNKDIRGDVFIIDDIRIYENDNYQSGNWTDTEETKVRGIDFIRDILSETHNIQKDLRDEGYLICTPKGEI
jgi:hypothetical protein